jgi:hypothetical protein
LFAEELMRFAKSAALTARHAIEIVQRCAAWGHAAYML